MAIPGPELKCPPEPVCGSVWESDVNIDCSTANAAVMSRRMKSMLTYTTKKVQAPKSFLKTRTVRHCLGAYDWATSDEDASEFAMIIESLCARAAVSCSRDCHRDTIFIKEK